MGYTIDFICYSNVYVNTPNVTQRKAIYSKCRNRDFTSVYHNDDSELDNIVFSHLKEDRIWEKREGCECCVFNFHGSWGCGTWEKFLNDVMDVVAEHGLQFTFTMSPQVEQVYDHNQSQIYYKEWKAIQEHIDHEHKHWVDEIVEVFQLAAQHPDSIVYVSWSG